MPASRSMEESWQVLQPPLSPRGSSSDGGGCERGSSGTEVSRTLDEKSCASSWEFVQRASSGPGSSKSPSCGTGCALAEASTGRCKDKAPRHGSANGSAQSVGSEASGDMLGEDMAAEGVPDSTGTCNWYPQDSMEIDAMLAQELGLLAGPVNCQFRPGNWRPAHPVAHCSKGSKGSDAFNAGEVARPCVPSVCEQAFSMLQTTGLRLWGATQDLPINGQACSLEREACCSEALSLKNFLDEDIPKFPFARSPHGAATWTRVAA